MTETKETKTQEKEDVEVIYVQEEGIIQRIGRKAQTMRGFEGGEFQYLSGFTGLGGGEEVELVEADNRAEAGESE